MTTPLDIRSAYEVLGLPDGASLDEVQAAYRELAQILHPDRYASNGHLRDRAQEQFKRVNFARDVLVDYLTTGRRPRRPRAPRAPARPPTLKERARELRARATAIDAGVRELRDREHDALSRRFQGWDLIGGAIGTTVLATFGFGLLWGALLFLFFGWWALVVGARDAFSAHLDVQRLRSAIRELLEEIAALLAEADELDRQRALIERGQAEEPADAEQAGVRAATARTNARVPDAVVAASPGQRRLWAWAAVTVAVVIALAYMAFFFGGKVLDERQAVATWKRMQEGFRQGNWSVVQASFDFEDHGRMLAAFAETPEEESRIRADATADAWQRLKDSFEHPRREPDYRELLANGRVIRAERTMSDYCLVDLELADGSRGDAGIVRSKEDDTWRITWVETPEEREGYE